MPQPLGVELTRREHRRPSENRGQRRPQLVRDGRQKLIFRAVGVLGFDARLVLAREQVGALLFRAFPFGDVANMRGEDRPRTRTHARDGELDREFAAVGAQRGHLQSPPENATLARRHRALQRLPMLLAQPLGNEDRGQLHAQRDLAVDPERRGRGRIEFDDASVGVDGDHAIERGVDDGRVQRFALDHALLLPSPIDELPDLRSGGRHQCQQLVIHRARFAREELHHAEHLRAEQDRKGERAVKAHARGGRAAREIAVRRDVVDPGRLS